jgi:hypothetical protein
MKRLILILGIITTITLFSCDGISITAKSLENFIPDNASTIYKINNLSNLSQDARSNDLYNKTKPHKLELVLNSAFFKELNTSSPSLVAFTGDQDDFIFTTKNHPKLIQLDSLTDKLVETLKLKTREIKKITIKEEVTFIAEQDSFSIISNSQKALIDLFNGKTLKHSSFTKLYDTNIFEGLSLYKRRYSTEQSGIITNDTKRKEVWTLHNLTLLPDGIISKGIIKESDSLQFYATFKGQLAQPVDFIFDLPSEISSAKMYTYSDAPLFFNRLNRPVRDSLKTPTTPFLETTSHMVDLDFEGSQVFTFKSIDAEMSSNELALLANESANYREVKLYIVTDPSFLDKQLFGITVRPKNTVFQINNQVVFTETESVAQTYIAAIKSNDVLGKSRNVQEALVSLSNTASLLTISTKKDVHANISNILGDYKGDSGAYQTIKNYPIAISQMTYDRDFAHFNFVCKEATKKAQKSIGVSEIASLSLEQPALSYPNFFYDYKTKSNNIVVQDIENVLHLFAPNGKKLWSKKLSNPILGKVNEIDLNKNGRKQLAFNTKNGFFVIDRNGNDVAPFPINFKDEITQPVAVFDYDNNRKYRFVIVQGKEILMYDKEAKIVKGFTYTKSNTNIVLAPQHIRMSNKDYLLFAEKNGKLNILSRTGKPRVNVSKTFDFENQPFYKEGSDFVLITRNKEKISISQNGKTSTNKSTTDGDYYFSSLGETSVSLADNMLKIKRKYIELPFGFYTKPILFKYGGEGYVSITETQEKKVYLYDFNGNLKKGFPVFGNGQASLSYRNKNLYIAVNGDNNEILLYRF